MKTQNFLSSLSKSSLSQCTFNHPSYGRIGGGQVEAQKRRKVVLLFQPVDLVVWWKQFNRAAHSCWAMYRSIVQRSFNPTCGMSLATLTQQSNSQEDSLEIYITVDMVLLLSCPKSNRCFSPSLDLYMWLTHGRNIVRLQAAETHTKATNLPARRKYNILWCQKAWEKPTNIK